MNNNVIKCMICGLAIFLILAMSGSSIFAANTLLNENDDTKNSTIVNNTNSVNLDEVYVSTTGNDNANGTFSAPYQSLFKAIQAVNENGTIHIANGVYKGIKNRKLTITKNMQIIQDTALTGVGDSVTFDAESLTQIINIDGTTNVVFNNLIFSNGQCDMGGALNTGNGVVTISNCKFKNNIATFGGGAISAGFNTTITNSTFDCNSAKSTDGAIGGAITNFGSLNLMGCSFNSNTATAGSSSSGGAINSFGSSNIIKCSFNSNSAGDDNGGVGGAIFTNDGYLYIDDCTFNSNLAGKTIGSPGGGGAIVTMGGYTNISHTSFAQNIAGTGGGAIYCLSDLLIDNSNFTSNQAGSYGGAIVSVDDVNITKSSFEDNVANYGAVMDNYNGTANVIDSTFKMNYAQTNGGTLYNAASGILNMQNNLISENYAKHCGGGIFNKGTLKSLNDIFQNNTVNMESGGGIENRGNATITDFVANGNKGCYGGAINNFQNMTLQNAIIINNTACIGGGGLSNNGNIDITSSTFAQNNVSSGRSEYAGIGGGLLNKGNMTLQNLNITQNQADIGGGIYNYNEDTEGILYILNSIIINNNAQITGGGIQNNATITNTNNTITNNTPNNINRNINHQHTQLGDIDSLFESNTTEKMNTLINWFKNVNTKKNYSSMNLLNWNL